MSLVKVKNNAINELGNIRPDLAKFFKKHLDLNFKYTKNDINKIKELREEGIVTNKGLDKYTRFMNSHNNSNICYYELNEENKTIKLLNFDGSENEVFELNDDEVEVLKQKSESINEFDDIFHKHKRITSLITDNHAKLKKLMKDREEVLNKLVATIEGVYKNEIAIIKSIKDKENLDFKSIVDFCINVEKESQYEINNIKDTISFFSLKGWGDGTIRAIKRDRKYQLETCKQNIINMYDDIRSLSINLYGHPDPRYSTKEKDFITDTDLNDNIDRINDCEQKLQKKLSKDIPDQPSIFDCCFAKRVREDELINEVNLSRNIKEDISRSSSIRSNGMKLDESMRSRFSK